VEGARFTIVARGCERRLLEILAPEHVGVGAMMQITRASSELDLEFAALKVENRDAPGVLERAVVVIPREPVIVRYYGARSCGPGDSFERFYRLHPDGRVELLEPKPVEGVEVG